MARLSTAGEGLAATAATVPDAADAGAAVVAGGAEDATGVGATVT